MDLIVASAGLSINKSTKGLKIEAQQPIKPLPRPPEKPPKFHFHSPAALAHEAAAEDAEAEKKDGIQGQNENHSIDHRFSSSTLFCDFPNNLLLLLQALPPETTKAAAKTKFIMLLTIPSETTAFFQTRPA